MKLFFSSALEQRDLADAVNLALIAQVLQSNVRDYLREHKAPELSDLLLAAHRVERLRGELKPSPEKRARLPEIAKADGKI